MNTQIVAVEDVGRSTDLARVIQAINIDLRRYKESVGRVHDLAAAKFLLTAASSLASNTTTQDSLDFIQDIESRQIPTVALLLHYSEAVDREYFSRLMQYSYHDDPPRELVGVGRDEPFVRSRLRGFERLLAQLVREFRSGDFCTAQEDGVFDYVWQMGAYE